MKETIDEQLEKIKELLEEYNDVAHELKDHHDDEQYHHLLHQLREKLIHLEELNKKNEETDIQKKEHFLKHHLEAVEHANQHWHYTLHQLMHQLDTAELEELRHRMERLMQEIQREQYELSKRHNNTFQPQPNPYANSGED